MITLASSYSTEPDYTATAFNIDVTQDVFGGMTSVASDTPTDRTTSARSAKDSSATPSTGATASALTQILTPRWYANMNFEVVSDDGYLGSPYRMALVFGAAVPERLPPTRTSRTLQFRTVGEVVSNVSVRARVPLLLGHLGHHRAHLRIRWGGQALARSGWSTPTCAAIARRVRCSIPTTRPAKRSM